LTNSNPRTPWATICGGVSSAPVPGIDGHDQGDDTFVSQLLSLSHRLVINLFEAAVIDERPLNFAVIDNHARSPSSSNTSPFSISTMRSSGNVEMVLDELFVTKQHAIFAVNGHDELRPHGLGHDANVFLRGVDH
jgi:hypothetical protein